MGLPLYTGEMDYLNAPTAKKEGRLESIGGRAPYDYKDAEGSGVSACSQFIVEKLKLLAV